MDSAYDNKVIYPVDVSKEVVVLTLHPRPFMDDETIDYNKQFDYLKGMVDFLLGNQVIDIKDIYKYIFINHKSVRYQLCSDYIMMVKSTDSDFYSFCQYAIFQIENLLNYYYWLKLSDNVILFESFFPCKEGQKQAEHVSEIPYATKFTKFAREFLRDSLNSPTKTNFGIQNIAYVRHSTLHRNSAEIEKYEKDALLEYNRIKRIVNIERTPEEKKSYSLGVKIEFKQKRDFIKAEVFLNNFIEAIKPQIELIQK